MTRINLDNILNEQGPCLTSELAETLVKNFGFTPAAARKRISREGANKRGNSSRLTQSFHFFMFEPIFSPVNALNQPI